MKRKNKIGSVLSMITAFILCTFIFSVIYLNSEGEYGVKDATYMEFKRMANNGEVESATIDKTKTTFEFKTKDGKTYRTENPDYDEFKFDMLENGIAVEEQQPMNTSALVSAAINLLFLGAMFYVLSQFMKQQSGGIEKKLIRPEKDEKEEVNIGIDGKKKINKRRTTFKDVAGLKQVKEDMILLVDFLKNPNKYVEAGAKLPKGVILYGLPGTGKTLLAKALAGEAGVPFFSMSGSDFIEMFVGMGAKRVRELFEEARKNAPCIIFIDELDAIGNSRSNLSSGNTEHRQTINALLNEMDGFNGSEGILVIAATNRIEDLDSALIRPGRFDKHISVPLPETAEERMEIIKLYTKNKKFAEDVNFETLSKETIGFSPADIEALLNEAVLISVQEKKKYIDRKCIDEAIYKKLLKGHAKDDMKRNHEEIELVAHHEAGHATIGKLCNMEVSKVTIIPSTSGAGGVNIIIPKKMGLYSINELKDNVRMAYGGRCAEYLLYGDWSKTTTGASEDIKKATEIIYNMISMYGMSEDYGMLNLSELNIDNKVILNEAIKMSKDLMSDSFRMLQEHKDMHHAIVDVLLKKETISGEELEEIYQKYKDNKPVVNVTSTEIPTEVALDFEESESQNQHNTQVNLPLTKDIDIETDSDNKETASLTNENEFLNKNESTLIVDETKIELDLNKENKIDTTEEQKSYNIIITEEPLSDDKFEVDLSFSEDESLNEYKNDFIESENTKELQQHLDDNKDESILDEEPFFLEEEFTETTENTSFIPQEYENESTLNDGENLNQNDNIETFFDENLNESVFEKQEFTFESFNEDESNEDLLFTDDLSDDENMLNEQSTQEIKLIEDESITETNKLFDEIETNDETITFDNEDISDIEMQKEVQEKSGIYGIWITDEDELNEDLNSHNNSFSNENISEDMFISSEYEVEEEEIFFDDEKENLNENESIITEDIKSNDFIEEQIDSSINKDLDETLELETESFDIEEMVSQNNENIVIEPKAKNSKSRHRRRKKKKNIQGSNESEN